MKDESFELLLGQEIREATTYYNFHNPIMFSNNFLKKRYVIGVESKNDWKLFMLMAGCIYSLPTENPISVVMKAGIKDIMNTCKYRTQSDLSNGIENLQGLSFQIGTKKRPIFDFMKIEGKQVYFRFDHSFSSNCQLNLKSNYTVCEPKVLNCRGSLGCLNLGLHLKSRSINNKGIMIRVPFNMMCLMFFGKEKSPKVMNGALKRDSTHNSIRDFFGLSFNIKSYNLVNGNYEVFLSRSKTKEERLEQKKKVEDKSKKRTLDERERFLDQREGAFEKNKDTLAEAAYQRGRNDASDTELKHKETKIDEQAKEIERLKAGLKNAQKEIECFKSNLNREQGIVLTAEISDNLGWYSALDHETGIIEKDEGGKIERELLAVMAMTDEKYDALQEQGEMREQEILYKKEVEEALIIGLEDCSEAMKQFYLQQKIDHFTQENNVDPNHPFYEMRCRVLNGFK